MSDGEPSAIFKLHTEDASERLYSLFQTLISMQSGERAALLEAVQTKRERPIAAYLTKYRADLLRQIG